MLTSGGSATAEFHSTQVSAEPAGWLVDGMLALHGTTAPIRLEVTSPGPDRFLVRTAITQSRYGIRPYSGFLGALKVRDEVGIEIEVDLS
jgi:polyisoprenoid-binding protein YceI